MSHEVKTLCPYCGVGCGILARTDGRKITGIRGDPKHPANFGRLCQKGSTVAQTVDVASRLRHAMVREERGGPPIAVAPAKAVARVARQLDGILQRHGPQAIAFYLSGQLTT